LVGFVFLFAISDGLARSLVDGLVSLELGCIGLQERQEGRQGRIWACWTEQQCDFLDVLSGGGEQTLLLYFA
jgi:hypothetical protein